MATTVETTPIIAFLTQFTMRLKSSHMLKNIKVFKFVSSEILEPQIKEEYLNKIVAVNEQDKYFDAKRNSLEIKRDPEKPEKKVYD